MTKLRIIKYLQCFQSAERISKSLGLFEFPGPKKNIWGFGENSFVFGFFGWLGLGFFSVAVVAQSLLKKAEWGCSTTHLSQEFCMQCFQIDVSNPAVHTGRDPDGFLLC